MRKKKYYLENQIESILWKSRFFVLIPVLIGVILFFVLLYGLCYKLYKLIIVLIDVGFNEKVVSLIISMIDISLLAMIILMFTWWIYELFVDEIDVEDDHKSKAKTLIVKDIDELKEKVGKVIIILLIVWLFKQILTYKVIDIKDIVVLALSILVLALALKFISWKK